MGRADYLELGDWNASCFVCGGKRKASTMRRHWQGYWVCPEHWEPRHPQDFVKGVQDVQTVPWSQPKTDTFVQGALCSTYSSIAGYAIAGCASPRLSAVVASVTPPPVLPPSISHSSIAHIAIAGGALPSNISRS
jgi:hypothetical protein